MMVLRSVVFVGVREFQRGAESSRGVLLLSARKQERGASTSALTCSTAISTAVEVGLDPV